MARRSQTESLRGRLDACRDALEREDFEALTTHTVAALDKALGGEQLWRIASTPPLSEATYHEGMFPAEVMDAIFAHAQNWRKGADIRDALALAARITAHDPGQLVLLDEDEDIARPQTLEALDAHRDALREWVDAKPPSVRAAAMHALARCSNVQPVDGRALVAALASSKQTEVVATAAIALGAVLSRLRKGARGKLLPAARTAWHEARGKRSPLVRVCVAAGMALATGSVDIASAAALTAALRTPAALPVSWGWRWEDGDDDSSHLAVRVLSWADVPEEARTKVAAAIAEHARGASPDHRWEQALLRCAFGDVTRIPKAGLAVDELDEGQRAALRVIGAQRANSAVTSPWLMALDIRFYADIAGVLGGGDPLRKPIPVGEDRQWDLVRIWKAYFANELTQDEVVAAITTGLSVDEAATALTDLQRSALVGLTTPLEKRDIELIVAAMRALAARGGLLRSLRRRIQTGDVDEQPAAIGILASYEASQSAPPASDHALIAEGLAYRPRKSIVDELLSRLGKDQRAALEAAMKKVRRSG